MGGKVAYEMAHILTDMGKEVSEVIIIDTYFHEKYHRFRFFKDILHKSLPFLRQKITARKIKYKNKGKIHRAHMLSILEMCMHYVDAEGSADISNEKFAVQKMLKTLDSHMKAAAQYVPPIYHGKVLLIMAEDQTQNRDGEGTLYEEWGSVCPQLSWAEVSGDHFTMMNPSNVHFVGDQLAETHRPPNSGYSLKKGPILPNVLPTLNPDHTLTNLASL